ncbi:sensor histidine kinase [Dyadobacter sp. BHUBP1]|uniref:sensor histidine kinase n=1 Tax=Dyadobacter sp. BHUBP1 TaxID=3424178 RepID=UPI003D33AE21
MTKLLDLNPKVLWSLLQGPAHRFTLQTRIFHFICIATLLVMVYVLIFSMVVGMIQYAWITAALIPLQLLLYYLSRVRGFTLLSLSVYSLLFHIFFVVSYRVSDGVNGSTLLSLCLVYFLSLAVAPRRGYLVLTVVNLATAGGLLWLEYQDPSFILTAYANRKEHFIDIASTYAVNVVMILIGLGYIISNYSKEKDKAEQRAMLLDELHEEKARLISVISHDYHTPLISLKKYLDIIDNYDLSSAEKQMLTNELRQSIVNTQNLLMNLLDMTKSEGRLVNQDTCFNPYYAVEDTIKVYQDIARAKGLTFESVLPETLLLKGNPYLFTIIVRNLINNAARACRAADNIKLAHEYQGCYHVFSVSDTGPGISESAQKDILDRWQNPLLHTLHSGGLGLMLSKKYTEVLGGELTFTTHANRGTAFFIKLPVIHHSNEVPVMS